VAVVVDEVGSRNLDLRRVEIRLMDLQVEEWALRRRRRRRSERDRGCSVEGRPGGQRVIVGRPGRR
jgi:hypothetical protein